MLKSKTGFEIFNMHFGRHARPRGIWSFQTLTGVMLMKKAHVTPTTPKQREHYYTFALR